MIWKNCKDSMANSPTRVANSVFWSGIERLSVQGIQFVLTIILARMVSPSDYGLIALLTVFLVMAQVFIDSGFSMALIQKQNPTDKDFSTVFYFNIIVGVAIYLFLFFAAKYIALFFKEPHLELIAKVVFLNIIITSFAVVQRAKLTIALNFKLQTVASLFAVISSGILGVYLAYNGYNVWALVLQTLLNNLLNVCCLWILVKWFPSFSFSWESFRQLFAFGSKLLLAGVISSFYGQLYTIVIGREFSTVNLGYYNRASSFANWFSINLSAIINRALFPVLCSMKDNEKELEGRFLFYMRMTSFIIFPLILGMIALAEPIIVCLFTEKWLPIVPLLRILCLAYMWDPVMLMNSNFLAVKGRTDMQLKGEILKKGIAVIILLITFPLGLEVVCLGLVVYSFADMYVTTRFVRKLSYLSLMDELKSILPIFLLSAGTAMIVWGGTELLWDSYYGKLIGGGVIWGISYVILSRILSFPELQSLLDFVRLKIKKCNSR